MEKNNILESDELANEYDHVLSLDLSDQMNVLYAYKMFRKYPKEIAEHLKTLKITGDSFGNFYFGLIEQTCLSELGEYFEDQEMSKMLKMSSLAEESSKQIEKSTEVDIKDGTTVPEVIDEELEHEIDENETKKSDITDEIATNEIIEIDSKTVANESKDTCSEAEEKGENESVDKFVYTRNLHALLKPLVNICNKNIVNIIYYVYKKTGINHFEFLFNEFKSESQRIELHILIAKGIRENSFDFSEVKEVLEETGRTAGKKETLKDSSSLKDFGTLFEKPIIPLPFEEGSSEDETDPTITSDSDALLKKPFEAGDSATSHLEIAKRLLLTRDIYGGNENLYIEQLAKFLSLKFDRRIFFKASQYIHDHVFAVAMNKHLVVPFFFYRYVKYEMFMWYFPTPDVEPFDFNAPVSEKPAMKVNCMLLKKFLETSTEIFSTINSPVEYYRLTATNFHYFVTNYRSPGLFGIFYELFNCSIFNISSVIKKILFNDISLYLEVFYNEDKLTETERFRGWRLNGKFDSSESNEDLEDDPSCKGIEYSSFRLDREDSLESLISAYHNVPYYQDLSDRISNHILFQFWNKSNTKEFNRNEFFNTLILEASANPSHKIFILKNINLISDLMKKNNFSLTFEKVIDNLKIFPARQWRYKKAFIQLADTLEELGVSKEWIRETLKNDKVFYIREMIKNL